MANAKETTTQAHTAGPWKVSTWKESDGTAHVGIDTDYELCPDNTLIHRSIAVLTGKRGQKDNPENMANARLIAAAPDGYALGKQVKSFINAIPVEYDDKFFIDNVRGLSQIVDAFISKSEGRA